MALLVFFEVTIFSPVWTVAIDACMDFHLSSVLSNDDATNPYETCYNIISTHKYRPTNVRKCGDVSVSDLAYCGMVKKAANENNKSFKSVTWLKHMWGVQIWGMELNLVTFSYIFIGLLLQ